MKSLISIGIFFHLTLIHSKDQGQGHAHIGSEYIVVDGEELLLQKISTVEMCCLQQLHFLFIWI